MYKRFFTQLIIILFLIFAFILLILSAYKTLFLTGILAFSFGVRHAVDADHIVAIDNMTRKFHIESKNPPWTGLYFALGHSTIVFMLTLFIALGVHRFHHLLLQITNSGRLIGGSVSAIFLLMTAYMNLNALLKMRKMSEHTHQLPIGILSKISSHLFLKINRPEKMYLIGLLFGLGFDTASQIGLLGISATASLQTAHLSLILLLPILFASGMVLTDSLNSLFMSVLYQKLDLQKNNLKIYSIITLIISLIAAISIAAIEIIQMLSLQLQNLFQVNFQMIGFAIIFLFLMLYFLSFLKSFNKSTKTL